MVLLSACGNAEAPTDDPVNSTSESTVSSIESSTTTGSDDAGFTSKNFDGKSFSVTYEQAIADFQ
ncbi:MAG: hypothetical protein N2A99_02420 [Carnobacterium alterfunditum]